MKKQIGVESHCDSHTGTTANDTDSESALFIYCTLHRSQAAAVYENMICMGYKDGKTYKCRWCRLRQVCETDEKKPKGPQLRSVFTPLLTKQESLLRARVYVCPSSVSPHGAPSNSPQQGNMRERGKMRVGSWMEGDKLTCGVLWGECPTSRPLITIR